jgi:CheY-like chemotaxis protein
MVVSRSFPQPIGEADAEKATQQLKDQAQSLLKTALEDKYQLQNVTLQDIELNGDKGLRATADLLRDNQKAGKLVANLITADDTAYTVVVASAQASVLKKANAILNSFEPRR